MTSVSPNLHVDHAVVRAAAAALEELLPALRAPGLEPADLDALARTAGGASLVAEHDRLAAAVIRADRGLIEVVTGLRAAADAVAAADDGAARSIGAVS
jgi:hypothetical protein